MKNFISNFKFALAMVLILLLAAAAACGMIAVSTDMKDAAYDEACTAARQYMEAGDYEQAISFFEDAYLSKATDEAAIGLAEAWFAHGDTEQAITVLANRMGLYQPTDAMKELLIQYKESIGIYEKVLIGGKEIPVNTTAIYLNDITLTEEDKRALSQFTEVVTLEMARCGLTEIGFLKDCSKLMSLDLDGNPVSDFTPLYNKPELLTLHAKDTAITDYQQLHELTSLSYLDLNGNWITLAEKEALETALPQAAIYFSPKFIISPITIAGETHDSDVTELDLGGKKIYDTTPLKSFTAVQTLNLSDNSISWLGSLNQLTTLTELNLSNNRLSNINALSSLNALTKFHIRDNNVTDISCVASMPDLTELDLGGNPIYHGHEALSGLKHLKKLNLQDTLLKDKHLEHISMDSMTELDLRNNKGLTEDAVTAFAAAYPNCTILHDYLTETE